MSIIKESLRNPVVYSIAPFTFSKTALEQLQKILRDTEQTMNFIGILQRGIAHPKSMPPRPIYTRVLKEPPRDKLKQKITDTDTVARMQVKEIQAEAQKLASLIEKSTPDTKELIATGYKRWKLGYGHDEREDIYINFILAEVETLSMSAGTILYDTRSRGGGSDRIDYDRLYVLRLTVDSYLKAFGSKIKISGNANSVFGKLLNVILPEAGYKCPHDKRELVETYKKLYG